MLFGGKLVEFKDKVPQGGKVEERLRRSGREKHSVTSHFSRSMAISYLNWLESRNFGIFQSVMSFMSTVLILTRIPFKFHVNIC